MIAPGEGRRESIAIAQRAGGQVRVLGGVNRPADDAAAEHVEHDAAAGL
jgi:hypothetical protein